MFITGRRGPELAAAVKEIGRNVTGVQGDVSNLGDLDRLFAQIKREKGKLDIVLANAELNLTERISLTPDFDFFWRQSTRDGIYGIPGNLVRSGRDSRSRYIGSHVNPQLEWRRHISLTTIY